ncbi:MAG: hypothetical protein H0T42_22510 [Deltaproteobacteria bacterium]|nr:hypothetical protein [Deltaproteobacteria bacterium]
MTKRFFAPLLGLVAVTACGGDDGGGVDASNIPATVTVAGEASTVGLMGRTPLGGVVIAAYREGETVPLAMTTSAANGTYTLAIPTNGAALDGYLLGTQSGKKDNYLYPPRPLTADITSVPVLMIPPGTFDTLGSLAQVNQDPTKGWVGVQVFDAANMPVAGATVTSSPAGTVKYNGSTGTPSRTATMTDVDGIAYVFNVTAGPVTISASGGGLTFFSHPVIARADQLTTTLIQP